MNGGYAAITSDSAGRAEKSRELFILRAARSRLSAPPTSIPVYSDYVSNIITVFEGNEQDTTDDKTLRDGVGKTNVDVQTTEDGTSVYTVQVCNTEGTPLSNGGKLPDGYRFLGWYENKGTEDAPLEVRVSRDPSYTLPADVDLTVPTHLHRPL